MLPREIQVEHWPNRTTYDFPRRPIGRARYVGWFFIGFAVLFAWMPGREVFRAVRHLAEGRTGTGELVIGAFTLTFVVAALLPLAVGLFIMYGRTRVVTTRDCLIVTEIAGPLRWRRKVKIADIERIEFAVANAQATGPARPQGISRASAVAAKLRGGKTSLLLIGYPKDWLEAAANELCSQMRLQGMTVPVAAVEFPKTAPSAPIADVAQQPAGSKITLEQTASGILLKVPSRGFWKGSLGLGLVAIVWCVFVAVFTYAMAVGKPGSPSQHGIGLPVLILAFWSIGAFLLVLSIHLGTRRWTIEADRFRLRLSLRSAVRKRDWEWQGSGVERIVVGDSHVEVNNRQLQQLQICPANGKKLGLLTGREPQELAWIATVLRKTLGFHAENVVGAKT